MLVDFENELISFRALQANVRTFFVWGGWCLEGPSSFWDKKLVGKSI